VEAARAALGDAAALVYLASIFSGSLALLVTRSGVEAVWLPYNGVEQADLFLDFEGDGQFAYLRAIVEPDRLGEVLVRVTPRLGRQLMAPVADRLRASGIDRVVLFPAGLLALLPLHAASYSANGRETTFLDEFTVSYSPTARFLKTSAAPPDSCGSPLLVGVGDPLSHSAPLRFGQTELAAMTAAFPTVTRQVLVGAAATRECLRDLLPRASHAHLACHGVFDLDEPLRSGLELARAERLTVGDLLDGGQGRLRADLVVLSACQTAVREFEHLPDEALGFAACLLQAGVGGVVGTLWPVEEVPTCLLMERFYQGLNRMGSAAALRAAQLWLRSLSTAEVAAAAERIYRAASPQEQPALLRVWRHYRSGGDTNPHRQPFAAPYYWAGYTFTGAVRNHPRVE
jgi:CHAT domain-containing protein